MTGARAREGQQRYLVVTLAGVDHGLPFEAVREIRGAPALHDCHESETPRVGKLVVRGRTMVLVDLRRLVGLEPCRPSPDAAVVILHHEGTSCGVLVDRAAEIAHVSRARVVRDGAGTDPAGVVAGVTRGARPLVLLRTPPIVAAARGEGS